MQGVRHVNIMLLAQTSFFNSSEQESQKVFEKWKKITCDYFLALQKGLFLKKLF